MPGASRRACVECRRRKLKCDRLVPTCSTCQRSSKLCDYSKPARTPLTRRHLTHVEEELARARSLLRERASQNRRLSNLENSEDHDFAADGTEDLAQSMSPVRSLQSHSGSRKQFTHSVDENGPGLPGRQDAGTAHKCALLPPEVAPQASAFEWDERDDTILQSVSGSKAQSSYDGYFGVASTKTFILMTGRQDDLSPPTMIIKTSSIAPDQMSLSSLGPYVDEYFERFHPLHPLLHETAFRAQMMNLYPRPQKQLWEMLLYAVAALGAYSMSKGNQDTDLALFEAARARFSSDLMEIGSKTLVQALTLMSRYLRIRNKLNTSYNYIGLANRVAIGTGLFKEFSANSNLFYCEVRRRVWWCLYTLNLEDTIAYSRPQDFPECGVEVDLPLNIEDLDLTPSTTCIGAEANYTTLYTYLKFGAAFYSTISKVYARITIAPYPPAHTLIDYDDHLIREWEASLPGFIYNNISRHPKYALSHAVLLWKCLNFRIIIYRPFVLWHFVMRHRANPPKPPADPDSVNLAIQRCQKAAEESIHMISEFWFQQQRSRLDGWYALQFLFPAVLIPVLCIRNEPTSAHSTSWQGQIQKAMEVMESISLLQDLAEYHLSFIKSLCSGVSPLQNEEFSFPHAFPEAPGSDGEPSTHASFDFLFESNQLFPEYLNFGV